MKPIIVAGDICEDVYLYSNTTKENPEHSSTVYLIDKKVIKPGMASNVHLNCLSMNKFAAITHNSTEPHIQKTRLYYKDEYISRIDNDNYTPKYEDEDLKCLIRHDIINFDAMIVCDYGKRFWNKEKLEVLNEAKIPIFIDPYPTRPLYEYPRCLAITPNYKEGMALTKETEPLKICDKIAQEVFCEYVVLKMGELGAFLFKSKDREGHYISAEKVPVVDVCGAGDTFIAALTTAYLMDKSIEDCVKIANKAAGITVQHSGVYVLSSEEWKKILTSEEDCATVLTEVS